MTKELVSRSEATLRNTPTPLLDTIEIPADLRKLDAKQLRQVAGRIAP